MCLASAAFLANLTSRHLQIREASGARRACGEAAMLHKQVQGKHAAHHAPGHAVAALPGHTASSSPTRQPATTHRLRKAASSAKGLRPASRVASLTHASVPSACGWAAEGAAQRLGEWGRGSTAREPCREHQSCLNQLSTLAVLSLSLALGSAWQAPHLGDERRQLGVAVGQPATQRHAVGLVLELLGGQLHELLQ